jgi:hypothetical protein
MRYVSERGDFGSCRDREAKSMRLAGVSTLPSKPWRGRGLVVEHSQAVFASRREISLERMGVETRSVVSRAKIDFTKEQNCFTHISDAAGLAKIADTLSEESATGRLSQVCERWIYSACLSFALDPEELQRSGFRYEYFNYQVEYRRNLIFEVGGQMDQVFQALIDRSRVPLNLKTIKTILGYQHRPKYRKRKGKSAEWEVTVERPTYDLTIFKIHCGYLTLKTYTKGERVLRIETVAHDVRDLDCGSSLGRFPQIISELKNILERFLDALSCIDQCSSPTTLWSNSHLPRKRARPPWAGLTSISRGCDGWPRRCWPCRHLQGVHGLRTGPPGPNPKPATRGAARGPTRCL